MSKFDRRRTKAEMAPHAVNALVSIAHPDRLVPMMVAGSYRRMSDSIGDLDLMVVTDAMLTSLKLPLDQCTTLRGSKRLSVGDGWVNLDVFASPVDATGAFAMFLTGPKDLNVYMRQRAAKRGLMLSQYGLFARVQDGKKEKRGERVDRPAMRSWVNQGRFDNDAVMEDEMKIYAALELEYIPPGLRNDWRRRWRKER